MYRFNDIRDARVLTTKTVILCDLVHVILLVGK